MRRLGELAPATPLMIAADGVTTTDDEWREELLRSTVIEMQRAIADGVPLTGYLYDTGIDGYEWLYGFNAPRGLIDRDRKIKASGHYLQALLTT